jgi:hypothetical protein
MLNFKLLLYQPRVITGARSPGTAEHRAQAPTYSRSCRNEKGRMVLAVGRKKACCMCLWASLIGQMTARISAAWVICGRSLIILGLLYPVGSRVGDRSPRVVLGCNPRPVPDQPDPQTRWADLHPCPSLAWTRSPNTLITELVRRTPMLRSSNLTCSVSLQ